MSSRIYGAQHQFYRLSVFDEPKLDRTLPQDVSEGVILSLDAPWMTTCRLVIPSQAFLRRISRLLKVMVPGPCSVEAGCLGEMTR